MEKITKRVEEVGPIGTRSDLEGLEKGEDIKEFPESDAVIVCGGELLRNKKGEVVVGIESKMRSMAALELWRRGLTKKIILTGAKIDFQDGPAISEAMKEYLIKQGVPEEVIEVETSSTNTTENIENALKIVEREKIEKVILETTEVHLLRARQLFDAIVKKHNYKIGEAFISAEELLNERSPHYRALTKYYQFPSSLTHAPKRAVTYGLREMFRRVLIYIDKNDRIATYISQKIRGNKQK